MGILYKGIKFPFQIGSQSAPATSSDDEVVKESLVQIIMTGRGERVMRPDLGSGAPGFVFENNDDMLQELVKADLRAAITKFEPRAIVQSIELVRSDDGSRLVATITFVVRATGTVSSVAAELPQ